MEWHDAYVVDDDGRRWALECKWKPEWVGCDLPEVLRRTAAPAPTPAPPPEVTVAVTPDGVERYRVYLQGELLGFGSGWHTLTAKVGRKKVKLSDGKRNRWVTLDEFYLLKPELIA